MAKRKEKRRELTIREWQDKLCADAGHEMAALVIKGRATNICLECSAFWLQMELRNRTPRTIAAQHFSAN